MHPSPRLSIHTAKCISLEGQAGEAALQVTSLGQDLATARSEAEAQGGRAQGLERELAAAAAAIQLLEAEAAASAEKIRYESSQGFWAGVRGGCRARRCLGVQSLLTYSA